MATIIQFPQNRVQESTAYKNLVQFFEVCDTVESCNLYLESVETCREQGYITEKEMYTLRRIGRQKRIELAHPEQKKIEVNSAGVYCYTPEMGEEKPDCQIESQLSYYGKHYYLWTSLELKGRGITLQGENKTKQGNMNIKLHQGHTIY